MTRAHRVASFLAIAGASACSLVVGEEFSVVRCAVEDAYGGPGCPSGETCVEGTCRAVGLPFAAACSTDAECRAPASCIDTESFATGGGKRCLAPCRTSEDCLGPAEGLVCRPLELAAASVCWPARELPARALPGVAPVAAVCESSVDCRSGLCLEGRCADACASDADCGATLTACRIATTPLAENPTWTCASLPAESSLNGACVADSDCRSGSCSITLGDVRLCAAPCCSSRDCGDAALALGAGLVACSKANGLRACSREVPDSAAGVVGTACSLDAECRSGSCFGEEGARYCTDLCCDDESCGDSKRFTCRLADVGGSWALRCVRR